MSKDQELYRLAYQSLIHNDLQEAAQKIDELLNHRPCNPDVRLLRGNIYKELCDFETALREYQIVFIFSCNPDLNEKATQGIQECCQYYREQLLPIPQACSLRTLVSLPEKIPQPLHRLNISQEQVIELYNNIPQVLSPIALKVTFTRESYRSTEAGVWLEPHPQGKYWVILTQDSHGDVQDFLVPNGDIEIDWSRLRKSTHLFDLSAVSEPRSVSELKGTTFYLEKPGILEIHSSGQYWYVRQKGLITGRSR